MFCQAGFDQWLLTIMHHLSHLSQPQATVLALWRFGMGLARLVCAERGESRVGHGHAPQGANRAAAVARMVRRCPA